MDWLHVVAVFWFVPLKPLTPLGPTIPCSPLSPLSPSSPFCPVGQTHDYNNILRAISTKRGIDVQCGCGIYKAYFTFDSRPADKARGTSEACHSPSSRTSWATLMWHRRTFIIDFPHFIIKLFLFTQWTLGVWHKNNMYLAVLCPLCPLLGPGYSGSGCRGRTTGPGLEEGALDPEAASGSKLLDPQ